MITVIDQPTFNLFENMNLSDAFEAFPLFVQEAGNDLIMDLLLTEHQYLYENGTPITYLYESGEDDYDYDEDGEYVDVEPEEAKPATKTTAEGAKAKNKILEWIDNIKNAIVSLFNKVVATIMEKTEGIRRQIATIGLSEKKIHAALSENRGKSVNIKVSRWVQDISSYVNSAKAEKLMYSYDGEKIINGKRYAASGDESYFNEVSDQIKDIDAITTLDDPAITRASRTIFVPNSLVKEIRNTQKTCENRLNDYKKKIKSGNDALKADRLSEIKNLITSNSNVARDMCKIYTQHFIACAGLLKNVIRVCKGKEAKEPKQEKKDK